MNNKLIATIAVFSFLLSLSGWGLFFYQKSQQETSKEQVAEYVLQQVEERKKMEESIKEQLRQKRQEQDVVMQLEYERQMQDTINNQLKQYEQDREEFLRRQFDDFRSWTSGLVKQQLFAFQHQLQDPLVETLREYERKVAEDNDSRDAEAKSRMLAYKEEILRSAQAEIKQLKEDLKQALAKQKEDLQGALAMQKEWIDKEIERVSELQRQNAPAALKAQE